MTLTDIFHEHYIGSGVADLKLIGRQRVLFVDGEPVGHVLGPRHSERLKRQSDGSYRGQETGWRMKRRNKKWTTKV